MKGSPLGGINWLTRELKKIAARVKENETSIGKLNSDLEWKELTLPAPTYNEQNKSYSYNVNLSQYKELEIRLWITDWDNHIDVRVISLTPNGNVYQVYFYNGEKYCMGLVQVNQSFIVVTTLNTNLASQNKYQVLGVRGR